MATVAAVRLRPRVGPPFHVVSTLLLGLAPSIAAADEPEPRPQRASVSYFGERAVQPGLRIGYDAAAWVRRPHELLMSGSFGGFAVPSGYALMVLVEGGYRLTHPVGLFLDLRPGIGYTAAWINAADGSVGVTNYFTLSALGGIGYDLYRRARVPLSIMARSGVVWRTSDGTGTIAGASYVLDVGLAYQFGTRRPKPAPLPVELPPPAEAPANLNDASPAEAPITPLPSEPPAPPATTPPATPPPAAAPAPVAPLPTPDASSPRPGPRPR